MKKIWIIFLFVFATMNCQDRATNENQKDWKEFLAKFPSADFDQLLVAPSIDNVGDSISRILVNRMIWEGSQRPETVYAKESNFSYPVGGKLYINSDKNLIASDKTGARCDVELKAYPFYKIQLSKNRTILSYLEFEKFEKLAFQTLIVLNEKFEQIGYFALMYGISWRYCKNDLNEILSDVEPLSCPIKLLESPEGFVLHDQMVGSYYEDTLQDQYWTVIIRDDGKFEIIDEKKNYEDGTVTLWSKEGYAVSDPDGYVNMRTKPSASSEIITKLNNETKLDILDASSDWWNVSTEGKEGFIHKSRIQKL